MRPNWSVEHVFQRPAPLLGGDTVDALAKLFAEVTEFLVGGVLFLGSVALLAHALFEDEFRDVRDWHTPSAAGGALTLVAVALVYAFGVLAEGISRMLVEPRLTTLTARRDELVAGTRRPKDEGLRRRLSPEVRAHRKAAISTREEWRLDATRRAEPLGNTIEAQLKRLRVERTLFLSGLICVLALSIDGRWGLAASALVLCAAAGWLVNERFGRFLGAIVRAHGLVQDDDDVPPDAGVPTGASA